MATLTKVSQLLVQNVTRISPRIINQNLTTTCVRNTGHKMDTLDEGYLKYDVPKYKKINAWNKENQTLKVLGKILSSKRDRSNSDSVVLEGKNKVKMSFVIMFFCYNVLMFHFIYVFKVLD